MPIDNRFCLKARWILPVSGPALEHGCLVIAGDRIESVSQELPIGFAGQMVDYGEAVIVPGLINLHTHLDYTHLLYFDCDSPFFKWIAGLVKNAWTWDKESWRRSAVDGAKALALSGTSFAADASYSGAASVGLAEIGLRGVVGLEIFGVDEQAAQSVWDQWLIRYQDFVENGEKSLIDAIASKRVRLTVAPHTPYTVCPALLKLASQWALQNQVPMLLHVAESDMECRWLAGEAPDVDDFLRQVTKNQLPDKISWKGHGKSPVKHLADYDLLNSNMLAAHVVKVSDEDLDLLADAKVGIGHCPRSNARLRNGIARVCEFHKRSMNFGFGTDSAASTDDLDVLAESRFAWNLQRAVNPEFELRSEDALYYLTLGAAKAVGMSDSIGSLEVGKLADIAVFSLKELPDTARSNPHHSLIYGGGRLSDLFVGGKAIVKNSVLASGQE